MEKRIGRVLDWLDSRNDWKFVTILYISRWLVLTPIVAVTHLVFTDSQQAGASMPEEWKHGTTVGLFLGLVVVPPLLETLFVCTLPYWIISRIRKYRRKTPKRAWGFVAVSACGMGTLHPIPAAIPATLITGVFLAYSYGHFAATSTWRAIAATWIFHGAINMVGWIMLMTT